MHSLATAISNPVSRKNPFSVEDWPTVIVLKKRSLTSSTRFLNALEMIVERLPCNTIRIDIKSSKPIYFLVGQLIRVGLVDAQLL